LRRATRLWRYLVQPGAQARCVCAACGGGTAAGVRANTGFDYDPPADSPQTKAPDAATLSSCAGASRRNSRRPTRSSRKLFAASAPRRNRSVTGGAGWLAIPRRLTPRARTNKMPGLHRLSSRRNRHGRPRDPLLRDSEQSEPFSENITLGRQNQRAADWTAPQEG
jgi:hypothetical protein